MHGSMNKRLNEHTSKQSKSVCCIMLATLSCAQCCSAVRAWLCTRRIFALTVHARLQSQRQLQLSLEAHGRYITSLIEREGLQHSLMPQLVAAAAPSLARTVPALAALAASMPPGSSGQTSDQQTHYMPLSASVASEFSPQQLLVGGFASLPDSVNLNHDPSPNATDAARSLDVAPSPLSRHVGGAVPRNPFGTINQNAFGEPSSPGLLLNTDLQAAAAAWDDHQRHILTGSGSRPLDGMPAVPGR